MATEVSIVTEEKKRYMYRKMAIRKYCALYQLSPISFCTVTEYERCFFSVRFSHLRFMRIKSKWNLIQFTFDIKSSHFYCVQSEIPLDEFVAANR